MASRSLQASCLTGVFLGGPEKAAPPAACRLTASLLCLCTSGVQHGFHTSMMSLCIPDDLLLYNLQICINISSKSKRVVTGDFLTPFCAHFSLACHYSIKLNRLQSLNLARCSCLTSTGGLLNVYCMFLITSRLVALTSFQT